MPKLNCTEHVCRHEWSEPNESRMPRCPRCGGLWVRVDPSTSRTTGASRRRSAPLVGRSLGAR